MDKIHGHGRRLPDGRLAPETVHSVVFVFRVCPMSNHVCSVYSTLPAHHLDMLLYALVLGHRCRPPATPVGALPALCSLPACNTACLPCYRATLRTCATLLSKDSTLYRVCAAFDVWWVRSDKWDCWTPRFLSFCGRSVVWFCCFAFSCILSRFAGCAGFARPCSCFNADFSAD